MTQNANYDYGVSMKRLITLSSGLLAMMLIVAFGCAPEPGGSAALDVPEGMESATFSVSGMV